MSGFSKKVIYNDQALSPVDLEDVQNYLGRDLQDFIAYASDYKTTVLGGLSFTSQNLSCIISPGIANFRALNTIDPVGVNPKNKLSLAILGNARTQTVITVAAPGVGNRCTLIYGEASPIAEDSSLIPLWDHTLENFITGVTPLVTASRNNLELQTTAVDYNPPEIVANFESKANQIAATLTSQQVPLYAVWTSVGSTTPIQVIDLRPMWSSSVVDQGWDKSLAKQSVINTINQIMPTIQNLTTQVNANTTDIQTLYGYFFNTGAKRVQWVADTTTLRNYNQAQVGDLCYVQSTGWVYRLTSGHGVYFPVDDDNLVVFSSFFLSPQYKWVSERAWDKLDKINFEQKYNTVYFRGILESKRDHTAITIDSSYPGASTGHGPDSYSIVSPSTWNMNISVESGKSYIIRIHVAINRLTGTSSTSSDTLLFNTQVVGVANTIDSGQTREFDGRLERREEVITTNFTANQTGVATISWVINGPSSTELTLLDATVEIDQFIVPTAW